MDRDTKRWLLGGAMIALGLIQASTFALSNEPLPAALGVAYTGCGVGVLHEAGLIG